MAPNLGPNASLGYTPFEYWKGPKPVLPRQKRKSRGVALDLESLLPTPTLTEKPRAAARWPGQRPPAGVFVAQPGTYAVSPNNHNGSTPFSEILVVPPKVLVHPLFRDEINTPEWPMALSPYPGSMNDSDCEGTMDEYGFPNERRAQKTAWWNPKGWTKRIWAGLGAAVVVIIVIAVAVTVTQNNKNRYPDYSKLSYKLSDTYSGEDFFDEFDYFNTHDPTGGMNLTYATSDTAVLRVDHTTGNTSTPDASTGRFSVRVESKTQYDKGLFIFDVKHTPYGCASWPAL
ncbi:putative glycosidase C21B10.07 [Colletotrichum tanaceti]|uniref:Putative glycosidase C21B10.07 n=1 Tax=Colletotrichum tanaceti TaxID=1306861 RepID=A0A4U6XNL3_9PEZI|nr:putative glycosidase C21B10.07 [Colletotrichum tanaceti]TKW57353.1 putative glycosidase C21B10.07 [Colletotrichum tanaceti]